MTFRINYSGAIFGFFLTKMGIFSAPEYFRFFAVVKDCFWFFKKFVFPHALCLQTSEENKFHSEDNKSHNGNNNNNKCYFTILLLLTFVV